MLFTVLSLNAMRIKTDDLRIREIKEVIPPAQLHEELPMTDRASQTVAQARQAIQRLLRGQGDRLLVISGPCSIHDTEAARDYANRLKHLMVELTQDLLIIMRVYFEKPRTTVG
jgi:3-deoxy-7-phosphoheptulonate synthase